MTRIVAIASAVYTERIRIVELLQRPEWHLLADIDNAYELFELIKQKKPDLVVLDCRLAGLDLKTLLAQVDKTMISPPFFVLLHPTSDSGMIPVGGMIPIYLPDPFDFIALQICVEHSMPQKQEQGSTLPQTYQLEVTKLLQQMRVPAHMFGYACLRDGIVHMLCNPHYHQMVTKVIYVDIAEANDTTKTHVERAIRTAIEHVWYNGNQEVLAKYFGRDEESKRLELKRPSNAKFMATIAEALRLEQEQYKI